MIGFDLKYRADRFAAAYCAAAATVAVAIVALVFFLTESNMEAEMQAVRDHIAATPLVRICADGTRIYRSDGKLMIYSFGGGKWYFAPEVTPESACPSR